MTTTAIRKKLIAYIADADDKKVKGLYMLIEGDLSQKKYGLSATAMRMLEKERAMHIKGKTKSYRWDEVKEIIRGKRKL